MSNASAHLLSYCPETTRGETPTSPRFRYLPDCRTTLALTRDTLESERVTGTRFPAIPRSGAKGVSGDIPADLSFRDYDYFIQSALQGTWVESGSPDTITLEVGGVPNAGTEEGDSFSTTNGDVVVETIDAKAQEVVLRYDPDTGTSTTSVIYGLDSVTIDSETFEVTTYESNGSDATVKAGNTRQSFSIYRDFSDIGGGKRYLLFKGCEVNTWNLQASANGLIKSTFTFLGISMFGPSNTVQNETSFAPAYNNSPFDSFSGEVKIDGTANCEVTDFNLTVDNGMAARFVLGCDTSQDPSVNESMVSGSATMFFENTTLYEKFLNEVSFTMELTFYDTDTGDTPDQMTLNLPNLRMTSGTQPDVTGDGPITIVINFSAHYEPSADTHVSARRISIPS